MSLLSVRAQGGINKIKIVKIVCAPNNINTESTFTIIYYERSANKSIDISIHCATLFSEKPEGGGWGGGGGFSIIQVNYVFSPL